MIKSKILAGSLAVFLFATIVAAVVLYHTLVVDVTVNEALSITTVSCSISILPGETKTCTFDVENIADVDLDTEFTWIEDTNNNGVIYETDAPKIETIPANDVLTVSISFFAATDTPIGEFNGTILSERI